MTDGYDSRFAWEDEDANREEAERAYLAEMRDLDAIHCELPIYDAEDMCTCEMGEMGMVEHLVPGCPLHDIRDGHESL